MITIMPRAKPSSFMLIISPLLGLTLTILTSAIMFAILGLDALQILHALFLAPLSDTYSLSEIIVKAVPLLIIALGLSFGFKAGIWNIGAEGQFTIGALCGGAIALYFYEVEGFWLLWLMMAGAIIGGALYAGIAAYLKTSLNVNEILVTLMLTYVAILLLSVMVHGPLRDPDGYNFPESRLFHDSALLPIIWDGTRVHIGIIIALILAVGAWWLMKKHLWGLQVTITGEAPKAALFAGFNPRKNIWYCLLLSGGLAGLAGGIEVSGVAGQLVPHLPSGYGFTAIIVAFVGRLHPLAIIGAALLIALSYIGGEHAQIALNLPYAITQVFQGLLLFFFLFSDILVRYKINLKKAAK